MSRIWRSIVMHNADCESCVLRHICVNCHRNCRPIPNHSPHRCRFTHSRSCGNYIRRVPVKGLNYCIPSVFNHLTRFDRTPLLYQFTRFALSSCLVLFFLVYLCLHIPSFYMTPPSRLKPFSTFFPAPHFPFDRLSSVLLLVWIPSPRFLLLLTFLLTTCLSAPHFPFHRLSSVLLFVWIPPPRFLLLLTFLLTTCLQSFSSEFLHHTFFCSSLFFWPLVFCPSRPNSTTTFSPARHFPFDQLCSLPICCFFVSCSYLSVSSCFIASLNTNPLLH